MLGGLARRAGYINLVREKEDQVILVDAGDAFDSNDTAPSEAALILKAMQIMGYDAHNLGQTELGLGFQFLDERQNAASSPFLAANLIDSRRSGHPYQAYFVKKIGHINVGIIGLMSPSLYTNPDQEIQNPAVTLRNILPQIKEKSPKRKSRTPARPGGDI